MNGKTILRLLPAAAILLGVLLAGCQSRPDYQRDEAGRARLGVVLPLSGPYAPYGEKIRRGIECAVEKLRESGFQSSELPMLVVKDDRGRGSEAATAVRELAASGAAAALVGYMSTEALAVKTPALQLRFPILTPTGSNDKIVERNPWMFQVNFQDSVQARALAYYARYTRRCGRLAVMMNIDEQAVYAQDLARQVGRAFQLYGGAIARVGGFRENDSDVRPVVRELLTAAPDVIFVPAYPAAAGRIVRQIRETGFGGLILGSDSWEGEAFLESAGNAPGDIAFPAAYSPLAGLPAQQEFDRFFREKYGYAPGVHEALGYDAAVLMILAMRHSDNSDEIADRLRGFRRFPASGSEITIQGNGSASRQVYLHGCEPDREGKLTRRLLKILTPQELKHVEVNE